MTVLLTGASGFVGSAVLRKLLARGDSVRVLVRPESDRRNLEGLDVTFTEGNLLDGPSLERAASGCTALYHVAADYRLWVRRPQEMYDANVEGTRRLMQAALAVGMERVVYTSSVATLGLNKDGSPAHEATPVSLDDMIGHYKRSKYLAEDVVKRMVTEEGLPAVIVNPSTPIGPRDIKPTPTGKMIVEAAAGRMPAYVDTGLNVVHVDDVAEGHLLAYDRGVVGERYILGGQNMALRDILAAIASLTGRPAPRIRLPHDLLWPVAAVAEMWGLISGREPFVTFDGLKMSKKRMFFASDKATQALGYQPRPALDALKDAVTWFREAGYYR